MKTVLNIFWFRRDLRLADNVGLSYVLQDDLPVLPLFIFDRNILDLLENKKDARVEFIFEAVRALQKKLTGIQSSLEIHYGDPVEVFSLLTDQYRIGKVIANEDYEPYARARDEAVGSLLAEKSINFLSFKDQVIFSKDEILKADGEPYTVFAPYSNKWKTLVHDPDTKCLEIFPVEKNNKNFFKQKAKSFPTLASIGFISSGRKFPSPVPDPDLIRQYAVQRDYPGLDATSYLGVHLRFGTLSIRQLVNEVMLLSQVFLNELIWRDFYQMILWQFPKVGTGHAFKPAYEKIPWRNNEEEFSKWCAGKTGYPMVDAGMRQLNETGFMHNRMRMLTASFLTKHLLIDWRWGEGYFAERLLDFDLASNNGGWQWAAGSGCDAAPYFRIFNPDIQRKKFDPEGTYIKKWLPDLQEFNYPAPIIEHSFARDRAIRVYKKALTL